MGSFGSKNYVKLFVNHSEYEAAMEDGHIEKPLVSHCIQENEIHINQHERDYNKEYFTIESLEDNNTISIKTSNSSFAPTISVSIDNGETWNEYTTQIDGVQLATLNKGDRMLLKGNNPAYGTFEDGRSTFFSSGDFKIYGNITSLLLGDDFKDTTAEPRTYMFSSLFEDCTNIISAENLILPIMELVGYTYHSMFAGCTNLVVGPAVLPATTLGASCYSAMFGNCSKLLKAPELPATTLRNYCYATMFQGCKSLRKAPVLPATSLVVDCYREMFSGCEKLNYIKAMCTSRPGISYMSRWVQGVAENGTFVKNSAATWRASEVRGLNGVPENWTIETASE